MIFSNLKQAQFSFRLIVVFIFLITSVSLKAYDFEKDGLYYNILSESTVECCGGGQSPSDATYRKTEISIPSTVQVGLKSYKVVKIADYAWGQVQNVVWIRKLTLPNTITEIGDYAFRDATNIESIILPKGLKRIGDGALQGPRLAEYIFPKSLESIGKRAFNSRLKTVIFTSCNAPSVVEETFAYQNGGIYDIFIPAGFKIYVPCVQSYSDIAYHQEYMVPFVNFKDNRFEYSGKKPEIDYTIDLPNNHLLKIDFTNLPSDAGQHNLILPGKIDESIPIEVPFDMVIDKVNLYITANSYVRQYGDGNPLFTANISGLQNNEDINDVLSNGYHLYTTATAKSDIGDYPILLSSENSSNYIVNFQQGVLNITKATLKLSVGKYKREYGTENPQFSLEYDGLMNDEIAPKWDKSPTFSTDATKDSNVGTYQITVDCKPHNYEIISIENGTLSISKAPLLLTADDIERSYYSENPEFTYTLSGLRNNDNETCLTKLPSFSCTASIRSDCGKYNITPANAEAENYDICYNDGKLTIFPASLILYPQNITREYGDPNPLLKYEAIGLKGDDNLVSALTNEPNLSTTATENSNVGEYAIIIGGATSKNYVVGYRQGIITVAKAPLTVVAENAERQYGEANPIFSRSYSGFKLDDTESSAFSVLPRLTCSATKTCGVGEYPIAVSGGTSRNYEIVSYENGVLNVTKAPLTLVATDKSRLYFEDNPSFDFTLIGLRNSDTKSCMSTQPSFKCTAVKTSNVGEYDIEPFNATAQNYTIDYQKGILSINKRALTASVGNYTKIYGSENPQFEIDYIGFVNSEDQSVLSNIPNIVCAASRSSDVGLYPISLEGGDALNYDINKYNSGSLTIEKADQVISWNQDLSNIQMYSQVALEASSSAGLPVSYEMSPNNVATLYNNNGTWYLDCFGSGAVNIRAVQNGDKNHNAASMVSNTLVVMGTGGDPSTPQIFLNIENAGTLPDLIADNRKYQIKNLRLTGYLNGTDIKFIREMAGSDDHGSNTPGVLETLDISGCTIVSGGRSYYKYYQTSDNKIGDYMFYNCKQLVNLLLPENTTVIEDYAFADCDRLSVISIPEGVEEFGIQAFCNDISLLRIPMPSSLISIKDYAFMGCNGVSEITIPSRVTNIGDEIVKDCQNISKINVADGNSHFASEDGVLYTSSFDELLIFPVNYESNSYIVKDGTKTIAPYAFVNSKRLNEVTLPSTLTNIGEDAFIGCVNLSSLQVKALNPPVCYNDCFDAVSKTRCELTVPNGCYSYYWVAPVWADFNKIKESDFSDIDDVLYNGIKVYVENRNIIIDGVPDGIQVRIFQVDGTLIYQVQSTGDVVYYSPVQSGIYIAVIANKAYKLKVH